MPRKPLLWAVSLLAIPTIRAQAPNTQNITLQESSCRNGPASDTLNQFVDVNTGTILSAQSALQLIKLLLGSNAPGCLPVGASYVERNFGGLYNSAYQKAGDPVIDDKKLAAADFVLHVARWANPAAQSATQAAAQPATADTAQLTIEQQRWYLIHKSQFLRPGRMFGAKTVYFVYLHLNKDPRANYTSLYSFGITKAIPQNQQNLQLLASILAPGSGANSGGGPTAVWGGTELDMWYSTADITVDSSVTDNTKVGATPVKLDQTLKIHNEPLEWWDVSGGVPIRKMSQLNFQSSDNTLVPQTVDKKSIYGLVDFYPFRKQRLDLAYGNFSWIPSFLAGLSASQQPLHQPLFAVGWGPRFVQFYFGAIIRKQDSVPTGATLAPGTSACTGWCPQFAFGLNLPIKGLQKALSSKTATSGGNANSQEGVGSQSAMGTKPAGQ